MKTLFAGYRSWPARGLILAVLSLAGLQASADAATIVWQQKDDFVRIEPAAGAADTPPISHITNLSPDAVRAILSAVHVSSADGEMSFLTEGQVALLAEPVSRALRMAGPRDDVVFAAHYSSSFMSIVGPPKSTAGRIFIVGDAVGLIIGQVQAAYVRDFVNLDPDLIRTGSRGASQQSEYRILPGGPVSLAQSGRSDWAWISPVAWTGTYGTPLAAAPVPPSMPIAPAAPVASSASIAPVPPAPPTSAAAPVPTDPLQIEQRFASLRHLLDQHLISESDYESAKAELLRAMTTLPPH